jgi:hypothetical protein
MFVIHQKIKMVKVWMKKKRKNKNMYNKISLIWFCDLDNSSIRRMEVTRKSPMKIDEKGKPAPK